MMNHLDDKFILTDSSRQTLSCFDYFYFLKKIHELKDNVYCIVSKIVIVLHIRNSVACRKF